MWPPVETAILQFFTNARYRHLDYSENNGRQVQIRSVPINRPSFLELL